MQTVQTMPTLGSGPPIEVRLTWNDPNTQQGQESSLSAPQPAMWLLRWLEPTSHQPREVVLDGPLTLGRAPNRSLVLSDLSVSRQHARIEPAGKQLVLIDEQSANGTRLNGTPLSPHQPTPIKPGDQIHIGSFTFTVVQQQQLPDSTSTRAQNRPVTQSQVITQALTFDDLGALRLRVGERGRGRQGDNDNGRLSGAPTFPPSFFAQEEMVSISALQNSGVKLDETTYLALGGGLGSFAWVDYLAICGAAPGQIASIGLDKKPYGRYERLCLNSQIPSHERLRSNSDACPDNLWGWPGYAIREIWGSLKRFKLFSAIYIAWQIFGEPTFANVYTPRARDVFKAIDREAKRIGWWKHIWREGHIKAIRKTNDGRYVVAYTQTDPQTGHREEFFTVAPYLHLSVGYPGVKFLDDLQQYRERTQDFKSVVNAYEVHEHVYHQLARQGGVVLIRGRGIVASRVIQRLVELRQQNSQITILHLNRTPLLKGKCFKRMNRPVEHHWEHQYFNWPKDAWGGPLRFELTNADTNRREQILKDLDGTTTSPRSDWRQMIKTGLAEKWYQSRFGEVIRMEKQKSQLSTVIRVKGELQEETHLVADFIIDCTGLESDIHVNPLLKDLIERYHLPLNAWKRLDVTNEFEISAMRNGNGRMYASGMAIFGAAFAPVDSFTGLQYTALRSVDALIDARAPKLRHLNGLRSFMQWLRWARGVKP